MKLLVTDIDETLSRGMNATAEVAEACGRLRRNGWRIMLATGRILATTLSHIRGTGSDLPAIVYDGGRIMDPLTSKALYEVHLDPSLALEIVRAGWEHPVELQIIGDERAYCRYSDVLTRAFFLESGVPVDDSLESPLIQGKVFRVIFHGIPGCIRTLQRDLKAQFAGRAEVVLAGENFLDVLPRGVSKGAALGAWLQTLPEPPEIIVAAGDHQNDLEMLASAHLAVAPEDAAEEVLRMAHVIMPSADRHGFSFLAEHLLSDEKIRGECGAAIVLQTAKDSTKLLGGCSVPEITQWSLVQISLPENANVIVGQSHFIKTVEDLYEALVTSSPALRFGIAFCEASGDCLLRREGNDEELVAAAEENARRINAGHVFVVMLREGYPINVLQRIRECQEVCGIFAATANPLQVILCESAQGRGVAGVIDGFPLKGVESREDEERRRDFLRSVLEYKR